MNQEPNRKSFSGFRNPLLYTSSLLVLGILYAAGTIYLRRVDDREMEQRSVQAAAAARRADDERTVDELGGNEFKILNFYATAPTIRRGETLQLCYGVSNAKAVKLEPQSNRVWPSFSRCVDVSPKRTTEYTLTAEDGNGGTKTSTLTVEVR